MTQKYEPTQEANIPNNKWRVIYAVAEVACAGFAHAFQPSLLREDAEAIRQGNLPTIDSSAA